MTFGSLVAKERRLRRWTQKSLAADLDCAAQWIGAIERSAKVPPIEFAVRLFRTFAAAPSDEALVPLQDWLSLWVEAEAAQPGRLREEELSAVQAALGKQRQPSSEHVGVGWTTGQRRTLEVFPAGFQPLAIVCGDRREPSPQTVGDLLAYSVSIIDLTFIPRLGLDPKTTRVVSDKVFVVMDRDYLEREFGESNLLVLGSPAVNMAARVVNDETLFRFNSPQVRRFHEVLHAWEDLTDEVELGILWKMARNPREIELSDYAMEDVPIDRLRELSQMVRDLLGNVGAKAKMIEFARPGILDPADGTVHGVVTRSTNDFGVISVGRNPFANSNDFVSISVGGIHGPGTAHAVRALAEDDFHDHPFGGVIEVRLRSKGEWPARLEKAHWKWDTNRYDQRKLLTHLEEALKRVPGDSWALRVSELIKDLTGPSKPAL